MNPYLSELIGRYPLLRECAPDIEQAFSLLRDCYRAGNKLLICGNGGSAADADHWSAELMKGFLHKRPLKDCGTHSCVPYAKIAESIPSEIAENLQMALPAIPLTGFTALATAFANDCDGRFLFAQLVSGLGTPGDVLAAISTSGNSQNIVHAVRTARAIGLKTIGLTGLPGGCMAGLVDVCIRVPARKVHEIQELHQPVYHALSMMLEEEFFGDSE